MAKTYDFTELTNGDAQSLIWALNWYRRLANDIPEGEVYPAFSLEDEEIEGLLRLTMTVIDGVNYYMPHEALIFRVTTDPSYAVQIAEESYSQTFVSPDKLTENIRNNAQRHLIKFYPEDTNLGVTNVGMTPGF